MEESIASNPEQEVIKLRRRVERERLARQAAEAAAEKGLRDLYEGQRSAELMRAVASAANEAAFIGEAFQTCLSRVCSHVGAPVGHAWLCPEEAGVVVATGIWHLEDSQGFSLLRRSTSAASLRRGEGLPGRVLETGRPLWVQDISQDRNWSRNMSCQELGVRAAFALPVTTGSKVAAVLEFFFAEAMPENPQILQLGADIGAQVGRVVERVRASDALARAQVELEARVAERTRALEQLNQELRREISERDAAANANRSKSEFLANMSHEIRTPLTAVLGYADLLLDPHLSDSDRQSHVQTVRRNGQHLLTIINDILDLSKIEAGKMTVESIPCSAPQIVADVASLMRVPALEKGLNFKVEFASPIPKIIQTDPTRLRQILMNLTGNAIKFTKKGKVALVVKCDALEVAQPKISFSIIDEGIGMSPGQLERLFRPFTQADSSTTRQFGGSGLGLVICKRLADMMGGTLEVKSALGHGSTFTLTVDTGPLHGVTVVERLQESGLPLTTSSDDNSNAGPIVGTVLLAEDGHDNQMLISAHLRKAGAVVTVAENGRIAVEAALEALEAGRPFDIILMDMQMPELDGYGATATLRTKGYMRPIVALTAHAMASDRLRCLNAGCDDYLSKPVEKSLLLSTVRRYVDSARPPVTRPEGSPAEPVAATNGSAEPPARASQGPVQVPPEPRLSDSPPLVSSMNDDQDMAEFLTAFVSTLPERVSMLLDAERSHDLGKLNSLAHQLKGCAGGFGFPSITASAGELELVARNGADPVEVKKRVYALVKLCKSARLVSSAAP
ncbi:MAG TPA: ATP-binding protein [Polyangiaceae bacterium]|jgi:signal transduction histidine kinase/HPt (histidine-containing phosphotransfer) domain-containing protein/ActR/RegA family two-component response regulator